MNDILALMMDSGAVSVDCLHIHGDPFFQAAISTWRQLYNRMQWDFDIRQVFVTYSVKVCIDGTSYGLMSDS